MSFFQRLLGHTISALAKYTNENRLVILVSQVSVITDFELHTLRGLTNQQLSVYAVSPGPGRSHQTGKMGLGHTSGWQI